MFHSIHMYIHEKTPIKYLPLCSQYCIYYMFIYVYNMFTGGTGWVSRKHVVFHSIHMHIHEETLFQYLPGCTQRCIYYMFTMCLHSVYR